MTAAHIQAIEMRASWLRWAIEEDELIKKAMLTGERMPEYHDILPAYADVLRSSDTYYMDAHFSRLVDHARKEVPDDLTFDVRWMQSKRGFLWLEQPFEVPPLEFINYLRKEYQGKETEKLIDIAAEHSKYLHAVGWRELPPGSKMWVGPSRTPSISKAGQIQFLFFQRANPGFCCFSYFSLRDGDRLRERMLQFEQFATPEDGKYSDLEHRVNELHEMRWMYCALHLMAQKYALTVQSKPDRGAIRRAQRDKREPPPWVRVITLRRLQEAKEKAVARGEVDWQWQWEVRGHWRNQWYALEGVHKPVFIDAHIKGPEDKPLKEGAVKLFKAVR